jgi:hypothetical protein
MSSEILDLAKARLKKQFVIQTPIGDGDFSKLHEQQRKLKVPYCDDIIAGVDVSFEPSISFVSVWVSTLTSQFNGRGRKFVESKVING